MEFRLLGPLEATDGDGALPLGGPKQRTVLALLLLQANHVVTAERLIDAIWGDDPPDTARNTLQTYIRHLRKAVGADRIQHRSAGYMLEVSADEVDLLRFDALVEEAKRLSASDLPGAAGTLREALGLWRGPALDDLADQASLRSDIARLEELRMAATEDRIAADLALGGHRELIPELEALIGRHPFRERLWGQLMVALYRSGRQGDALAAFHRAREVLTEELGIDPSPELQRLQDQILRQDSILELGGEPLRGYRLHRRIGEGAHGVVWLASQPHLEREVAVKAIAPASANDPDFVRRFEAEAQMVARLEHPHIVPLYDFWREPDGAYLVMRYLRGGSAEDLLSRGPLEAEPAGRMLDQVAQALSTAHHQGVVHRDVKPSNVLLDEQGNAYLSDFGIARDLARPSLSVGGDLGGPPGYVSPEVLRGEPASAASDIYSLGILLYRALAGRHPFEGTDGAALRHRSPDGSMPSIRDARPDLPGSVDRILGIAMAADPGDRYQDPIELATAFRQVLTRAELPAPPAEVGEIRNPYKGLRSFTEADAPDFFGRERMTTQLVARMTETVERARFLAVVGPSGSGKSSLVRAGLVPALRRGAIPGSERWFAVEMAPGGHPFEELHGALLRIAPSRPVELLERLARDEFGLLRAVQWILPEDDSELLLVIDQFEELFTLVGDETVRSSFLASLVAAVTDPRSRLRIVVTLRADFYDRPLLYRGFGEVLANRTNALTPLSIEELERSIAGPAERVGVHLEPPVVTDMVAEVAHQPGALPLLEYALTEMFDRRREAVLTLDDYHEVGGVSGAVARRAEELYAGLGDTGQAATRQLFLRLVTLGEEGSEDTRRRVLLTDLVSMEVERDALEGAIDLFGSARLLSFDRDPVTRGPTVEVAHEALIGAWARLRGWIESAREDVRMHRRLAAPAAEWDRAGRDPSFLLRGKRLEEFEGWAGTSGVALTGTERGYLAASTAQRDAERAEQEVRSTREARLEQRSRVRLRALVAVLAAATLVASSLTVVAVNRSREAERRGIEAVLSAERESAGRLTTESVAQLETDPELSLLLVLHAVDVMATLGERVPSTTVETLHWALQQSHVEYPVESGPAALVPGPLGTRGVFDLPLGRLVELARAHVTRSLTPQECEQYFGTATCPSLPRRFPPGLAAAPIHPLEPPTPDQPLAGTEVTLYTPDGDPLTFRHEFEQFTASTGIKVRLAGVIPGYRDMLEQIAGENPPDLAMFGAPGQLAGLAREGQSMDLSTYLDVDRLEADQSPYLVSLGTIRDDGSWPSSDGRMFGAFVSLNPKSMIWYPVPELRTAGYAVPQTWSELLALSDRLVADGSTPWCVGFLSGPASGYPGTDWIEDLVLTEAGPEVYDRWTFHEIPFDSPVIRRAFHGLGTILFTDGFVRRDARAAETYFGDAQLPMVESDPPGCWLYHFPTFAARQLPPGTVGTETAVFPFPAVNERYRHGMVGGGDMVAAFADRPEVREVVRYLLGAEHGAYLAEIGNMPANRRFDVGSLPRFWRGQAKRLQDSLAADAFRFDASDLMPPEIGTDRFWDAMMTYARQGPKSLDRILADLDAAWPDDR